MFLSVHTVEVALDVHVISVLGPVDVLPQDYASGDEVNEGEKPSGEFVETGEDTPIVLHEAKHDLDLRALFVERPVDVTLDLAVGFGRTAPRSSIATKRASLS